MPKHYITVREAAARLRVHDRTVRAYLREGRLTRYTIRTAKSHRVRLDESEVERMVQARSPEATGVGS